MRLRVHAAERLQTQRERGHVEQHDVADFARQHAGLNRRADRDDFVGVDGLVELFAGELLDELLDHGHARRAADHDDFVDLRDVELGVGDRVLERLDAAIGQILREPLEVRARERDVEVLGTVLVGRDERQVDRRLHDARQLDLRLLRSLGQTLQRLAVGAQVDALFLAELADEPVDDALVVVVAAQVRVAVGRLHLEHAVADLQDRHVERAAAEIPHEDRLAGLLVEPVRQCGGRRLVDDAQDFEPRDLAGVLRRLPLRVVEVRGHGDDGFGDPLAEIRRSVVDELLQDHRADLLRRVVLAVDLDLMVRAHVPLDRGDRAVGVGDGLALRKLTDEPFAGLRERHDRRSRSRSFGVGDDGRALPFHHGDDGVRRAEVDSDHFCHVVLCLAFRAAWTSRQDRSQSGLAAYRRSRGVSLVPPAGGTPPILRRPGGLVPLIRCDNASGTMVARPKTKREARLAAGLRGCCAPRLD